MSKLLPTVKKVVNKKIKRINQVLCERYDLVKG